MVQLSANDADCKAERDTLCVRIRCAHRVCAWVHHVTHKGVGRRPGQNAFQNDAELRMVHECMPAVSLCPSICTGAADAAAAAATSSSTSKEQ